MNDGITRPQAEKRKISSKNEFELCYIRHQYFRRSTYNPSHEEMAPYLQIVKSRANHTFYLYKTLFQMVGFEAEDIINIGRIHLVSFLGLFSMEMMPEKYSEFVLKFIDNHDDELPQEKDILVKNQANFTIFLKQRMEEIVRICRQKVRNIKGVPIEEFHFFCGPSKPPKRLDSLLDNYTAMKFKKIDMVSFRTAKKRARKYGHLAFRFDKMWYVSVPVGQRTLGIVDFTGAGMDPHDNMHNMNPEQVLFAKEDDEKWSRKRRIFKRKTKEEKAEIFKKFIEKNKNSSVFHEEVEIAQKMLDRA
jgi:hypothetical protein